MFFSNVCECFSVGVLIIPVSYMFANVSVFAVSFPLRCLNLRLCDFVHAFRDTAIERVATFAVERFATFVILF